MFGVSLTPAQWGWVLGIVGAFACISLLAIRDAFHREFATTNEKMAWIQLAVLVPFVGGIVYMLWGRKRGRKIQWKK